MKHYEITIDNGHYPLTYKCSTISEAYGCLMEVSGWASHIHLDPDGIMETLVYMRNGTQLSFQAHGYCIAVREGEV